MTVGRCYDARCVHLSPDFQNVLTSWIVSSMRRVRLSDSLSVCATGGEEGGLP